MTTASRDAPPNCTAATNEAHEPVPDEVVGPTPRSQILMRIVGRNPRVRSTLTELVPFLQVVGRRILECRKSLLRIFAKLVGRIDQPHRVLEGGRVSSRQVEIWIKELEARTNAKDVNGLIRKLREIVPEYSPSQEILSLSRESAYEPLTASMGAGGAPLKWPQH